jgi:hypothetical protein
MLSASLDTAFLASGTAVLIEGEFYDNGHDVRLCMLTLTQN